MTAPTKVKLLGIVGFLAAVEIASGTLQGFYTPIVPQITQHLSISTAGANWFEAAQLVVSALIVPVLARLGDLKGHRKVLLGSAIATAIASWGVALAPNFQTFLVAWSLQGFFTVWLPLEVSIIHRRTAETGAQQRLTRRSAAVLVVFLELGVIAAALTAGQLVGTMSMNSLLMIPAAVVTLACLAIAWGVPETPALDDGKLDWAGFGLVTVAILILMAGLILIRLQGPGSLLAWLVFALGLAAFVPFWRHQAGHAEPLVDVKLLATRGQWPVQLTAFLFGMSVLGAQIPLSTYAQADPAKLGYGLGATPGFVSTLIAIYVVSLVIGAALLPAMAAIFGARNGLIISALLVSIGYGLWVPFHSSTVIAMVNMLIAGIGSGALVASLPAAAAATAPEERTGFVTGMTNTTKTLGGAIASAIFAIALSSTGAMGDPSDVAPLSGYITVWSVCALSAVAAAISLLVVPKAAFSDRA